MKNVIRVLGILIFGWPAFAARPSVQTFLDRFYSNPKKVMWELPVKTDGQGRVITGLDSRFPASEIQNRNYVKDRDRVRRNLMESRAAIAVESVLSGMAPEDRPENLLEMSSIAFSPAQMDAMGLSQGQVATMPWSDTYWPMYDGTLAERYADPYFPDALDWFQNYNYVQNDNALTVQNSGSRTRLDDLAPTEKYDLWMGDTSLGLTAYNWNLGGSYYNASGSVATWMGICEGWAAAAIFENQPVNDVDVTLANGATVTFYPSDIRGLASLMWSKASPPVRFIGDRCDVQNPATDANGRIIDEACFNTNPGTWHVSVVNDIGVAHRSFIMDASYDYQVWNQPVSGYSYSYFNPQTGATSDSAADVTIPLSSFTRDKFSPYRSPYTQSVVGVAMDVAYVVEASPTHATGGRTSIQHVQYVYDLELDSNGNIIGGEWYQAAHPDFLWTPPVGSQAHSVADDGLSPGDWSGSGPVPQTWMYGAGQASQYGQPLEAAIEKLISLAR